MIYVNDLSASFIFLERPSRTSDSLLTIFPFRSVADNVNLSVTNLKSDLKKQIFGRISGKRVSTLVKTKKHKVDFSCKIEKNISVFSKV